MLFPVISMSVICVPDLSFRNPSTVLSAGSFGFVYIKFKLLILDLINSLYIAIIIIMIVGVPSDVRLRLHLIEAEIDHHVGGLFRTMDPYVHLVI